MLSLRITKRDLRLFNDLYEHSFLCFYQIRRDHFDGKSISTVYNRLSKLMRAGFIESMSVNLRVSHLDDKDIGVIYFLTKDGFRKLKEYSRGRSYRDKLIPVNLSQLGHDLILTDALKVIKKRRLEYKSMNSKLLKLSSNEYEQIPDGVILDPAYQKRFALEIELTSKSHRRYREILTNYGVNSKFDGVLYLVKDETITRKILETHFGYKVDLKDSMKGFGKFSFLTLKNYFNEDKEFDVLKQKTRPFETHKEAAHVI